MSVTDGAADSTEDMESVMRALSSSKVDVGPSLHWLPPGLSAQVLVVIIIVVSQQSGTFLGFLWERNCRDRRVVVDD